MTRDSRWWWVPMVCAIITAIASRMDVIDRILPAQHTDTVHAWIELAALLVGVASAFLKASPLPISERGRQKYIDREAEKLWPTR